MIRTRVGYTGGTTEAPTYSNIGDHTESIQIDFDPSQVSYAELLTLFWESHDPTFPAWSAQYASAVFYHDEGQQALVESTRREQGALQGPIHTRVAAAETFYRAEDYHQKYRLRNVALVMREFEWFYPDPRDFTDATSAARVNGVLGRHYTADRLEEELESFGLSAKVDDLLRTYASGSGSASCGTEVPIPEP